MLHQALNCFSNLSRQILTTNLAHKLYSLLSFLTIFFPFPPSPSVLSTENPSSSVEKQVTNDHAPDLSCKRRRGEFEGEVNDEEDDDGAPLRLQRDPVRSGF
jgi:hypothetical protein